MKGHLAAALIPLRATNHFNLGGVLTFKRIRKAGFGNQYTHTLN
jgi:hypothetical protein